MIWSTLIYTSLYVFIIWLSLAVTIGIFYCADLAEEHPTIFGKIIKYSIIGVLVIHLILFLEWELPKLYIIIGIVSHGCYFQLLKDYPRIQGLTNPWLIASLVALVIDNACWLWYFYTHYFTMMEILCFGQLLLWLVPFLYMISLSVNDNVLPGLGTNGHGGGGGGSRGGAEFSMKNLFAYFGFGNKDKKSQGGGASKPSYYNPHAAAAATAPSQTNYGNYGNSGGMMSGQGNSNSHMVNRGGGGGYGGGYQPAAAPPRTAKYD
mmetsp:Transcript_19026/g.31330  ORF Transcript_19026/g.31330 Transcript_19026/m.31330 type:complete len:264 (+) Transcript_19026:75-866(+)